jgi:hypothetical protein
MDTRKSLLPWDVDARPYRRNPGVLRLRLNGWAVTISQPREVVETTGEAVDEKTTVSPLRLVS